MACPSISFSDTTLPASLPAALVSHPTNACTVFERIEVTATAMADGGLKLRYRVVSQPGQIRLPALLPTEQADNLWEHTCCEAFIATLDGSEYREFNFSPSTQWAAYRFTDYRQRDAAFTAPMAPQISRQICADGFQLDITLGADLLPHSDSLALGLTAVVEAADGSKSYWALAHCARQPDFHLRQSFTLTLNRNTP